MHDDDEMTLTVVADTAMPPALRTVYTGLPREVVARVEHERVAMVEDTTEHLKRVHADLAPRGLFTEWCRAVGINPSTARSRIHYNQPGALPRQRARSLEPQRIEPGDEPRDYEVVDQDGADFEPDPYSLSAIMREAGQIAPVDVRQLSDTDQDFFAQSAADEEYPPASLLADSEELREHDQIARVSTYVERMLGTVPRATIADEDIEAWRRVTSRARQDDVLRRLANIHDNVGRIQQALLDARADGLRIVK